MLAETAAAAAVGALLGLGLGWVLGQGAVRLVTRTINDLYFVRLGHATRRSRRRRRAGRRLGLGAGLAAALAPRSRRLGGAGHGHAAAAARDRAPAPGAPGRGGGAPPAPGGAGPRPRPRSLVASFAGLFGVVLGLALCAPAFTVLLMTVLRPLAARLAGPLGRMATRTVARAVSRTGVAVAALMVAVSVTIGVSVMIASFRSTVANWLDLTLLADLYISAPRRAAPRRAGPRRRRPDRVAAVPGIAEVETIRIVDGGQPRTGCPLAVSDARRARSAALYRFADGDPGRSLAARRRRARCW